MQNVCIIGNSHAASLKNGWDEIETRYPGHRLTFFASRGDSLAAMRLEGNKLIPLNKHVKANIALTSGGLSKINLEHYDIFVLYGLGLRAPALDKRLSSGVIAQMFSDLVAGSLGFSLCKQIQEASDRPIFFGHKPQMVFDNIKRDRSGLLNYMSTFDEMERFIRVGNVRLIRQPEETLCDDEWSTKQEYSVDRERIAAADGQPFGDVRPEIDTAHMNARFGQLWLESLMDALGTTADSAPNREQAPASPELRAM